MVCGVEAGAVAVVLYAVGTEGLGYWTVLLVEVLVARSSAPR